ncbi:MULTISPECIES: TIGR03943 family putative permease subunit [unclassified Microbacterium]|uniref:TIGR03943 family putative permease subunit n=1 Tax=unclassified Microbacterium TaxID=2609290 RepID=UPI001604E096|nr:MULTISPECIES: TIGR03943 family protein [unclassified Microbacterium]QNA93916.1 TIGR03943 family protein [Microbacterium sp. Se63.02b]QYM64229.1 TIGR03943 family protein [Microbacterium sp. Se5.02b]
MSEQTRTRARALGTRWLGVGLAAVISVVTLGLGLTGRLTLYISPESVWFACAAAVVTLAGAIWSCTLPLGEEGDHGHDHGPVAEAAEHPDHGDHRPTSSARRSLSGVTAIAGGVIATGVVAAALVLPPASLSVQLAMSRAGEQTALFAGADTVALGAADTSTFGVGDWAAVFAASTNTAAYDGTAVTLTGFVTPGSSGDDVNLTRLVITHCVIDAQTAALPVDVDKGDYATGQWVEVTGTVRADADGKLRIEPTDVVAIDEPGDPYEY